MNLTLPYLRIFTPSVGSHTGSSVCRTSAPKLYPVIYPPPNVYLCAQIKTDKNSSGNALTIYLQSIR